MVVQEVQERFAEHYETAEQENLITNGQILIEPIQFNGSHLFSDKEARTVVSLRYDSSNDVCYNTGLDEERRADEGQASRVAVE